MRITYEDTESTINKLFLISIYFRSEAFTLMADFQGALKKQKKFAIHTSEKHLKITFKNYIKPDHQGKKLCIQPIDWETSATIHQPAQPPSPCPTPPHRQKSSQEHISIADSIADYPTARKAPHSIITSV